VGDAVSGHGLRGCEAQRRACVEVEATTVEASVVEVARGSEVIDREGPEGVHGRDSRTQRGSSTRQLLSTAVMVLWSRWPVRGVPATPWWRDGDALRRDMLAAPRWLCGRRRAIFPPQRSCGGGDRRGKWLGACGGCRRKSPAGWRKAPA
jgi:hypothetical protein